MIFFLCIWSDLQSKQLYLLSKDYLGELNLRWPFRNLKKEYFMSGPVIRADGTIAILKSGIVSMLQSFSETCFLREIMGVNIHVIGEEGPREAFNNHGYINCKLQEANSNQLKKNNVFVYITGIKNSSNTRYVS